MTDPIAGITVTPIAFRDPPLLNAFGVHEAWALRTIIEIESESGVVGLAETYGDAATLGQLEAVKDRLIGLDLFDINGVWQRVEEAIRPAGAGEFAVAPGTSSATTVPRIVGAFEVALYDLMGKRTGRPVYDLLGGPARLEVPFSAYLFFKWDRHGLLADGWIDDWGAATTPEGVVEQARRMVDLYGFRTLKLKGGVFEPELEIEAVHALKRAFPRAPARLDPNGAWTVQTTLRHLPVLERLLDYLEDPVAGIPAMASVQRQTTLPLATNMCVVNTAQLPTAIADDAVRVILSDHHYWGGLFATRELASICRVFGLGLSMHSNSHLGISLMAMAHAAAACPNLTYSCDTHYPWQEEEVIAGGKIAFHDGCVRLDDRPGLGVELDRDALATLHRNWQVCGIRSRDDAAEMRRYDPCWTGTVPRF